MTRPQLFTCLSFTDVDAAIRFLVAVGFQEKAVYRDENDPSTVVHAEFAWRDTGGIMFSTADREDSEFSRQNRGRGVCYCVVEQDADVDDVHSRALAAGATPVREPIDEDYGGRGSAVRDAEGNLWSFGSYPGHG